MMRNNTASSMQKTYDECYLKCSTAVYFEDQVRFITHRSPLLRSAFDVALRMRPNELPGSRADRHCCRITKRRPSVPGAPPWTRSTIIMPTASLPNTVPDPRRRGRCRNHCGTWRCNARSASTFSMPYVKVASMLAKNRVRALPTFQRSLDRAP